LLLLRYVAARVGQAALTLLGVSLLTFLALRLLPGGWADIVLGPFTSPEARAFLVQQYDLEGSVFEQYLSWLRALVHGDFGTSLATRRSIAEEMLRRTPATIELALLSTFLAFLVGLPFGVLAALRESGAGVRWAGRLVGGLGASTPEFVLGSILLFLLPGWSLGFSERGFVSPFEDLGANLRAMLVPAASLAVFGVALILRTTRDAVRRVLTEGHIVLAVSRGERPITIVREHVLRNAAIPIVTVTSTFLGYLLGGAVVAEVLFAIPGVGLYVFNALNNRDYGVVQAGVMISAAIFILINMTADIAYALIDPRVAQRATSGRR
jgi:peptide/nickel transport system permease protein